MSKQKAVSWESSGTGIYEGKVYGSESNVYTVHIDTEYLRKSFCNCPFADRKLRSLEHRERHTYENRRKTRFHR